MPDLSLTRWWDHQLEDDYPDCRLPYQQRMDNRIVRGRLAYDVVYCADCGKPQGLAPVEATTFVFYVCQVCVDGKGPPPGCHEVEMPEFRHLASIPPLRKREHE